MFRAKVQNSIFIFEGEREIRKLTTHPTELKVGNHIMQLDSELQVKLEERGEHYWSFVRRIMQRGSVEVNYDGPLVGQTLKDGVRYFESDFIYY